MPKKKSAPSNSTTIVIDMAHCRALKSPSTVVKSIADVPLLVQLKVELLDMGDIVVKSSTTTGTESSRSLATTAVVEKVFFRISDTYDLNKYHI